MKTQVLKFSNQNIVCGIISFCLIKSLYFLWRKFHSPNGTMTRIVLYLFIIKTSVYALLVWLWHSTLTFISTYSRLFSHFLTFRFFYTFSLRHSRNGKLLFFCSFLLRSICLSSEFVLLLFSMLALLCLCLCSYFLRSMSHDKERNGRIHDERKLFGKNSIYWVAKYKNIKI